MKLNIITLFLIALDKFLSKDGERGSSRAVVLYRFMVYGYTSHKQWIRNT